MNDFIKRTLIIVPPKKVYKKIRNNPNYIIYYNNWGFEYYDNDKKKICIY